MKFKTPEWVMNAMLMGQEIPVTVIGAGGTGSALLSKLAQMHSTLLKLGAEGLSVTVIDDDIVSETNIGRQAFYEMDIGNNKAETLVERFNAFLGTTWEYEISRFDENTQIKTGSFLFTCVDNPMTRILVSKKIQELYLSKSLVWIDGGNDATAGQVVLGCYPSSTEKDAIRIPSVYDLFGDSLEKADYNPNDSCSHEEAISRQDFGVNDMIAAQMAQLLWRMVRHGELSYHGVMLDLVTGEHTPLPINYLNWQLLGFNPTV